jgi:hypothetical protein
LGTYLIDGIAALTALCGLLVCVGLLLAIPDAPLLVLAAIPILVVTFGVVWRVVRCGVYEQSDGLAIRGFVQRILLPWSDVHDARIDENVTRGFRPQRTVVVFSGDSTSTPLYLWNERSILMLGCTGGLDALAARINSAVEQHH